jgi:Protein of unknown function (DUF2786)
MTPERRRIADRIIKLLALANSTTFAGEAETARRMAQELIAAAGDGASLHRGALNQPQKLIGRGEP